MTNNYYYYDYEILSTKDSCIHNNANTKWRVKLYHLNEEGQWDEKGTGHVLINTLVKKNIMSL